MKKLTVLFMLGVASMYGEDKPKAAPSLTAEQHDRLKTLEAASWRSLYKLEFKRRSVTDALLEVQVAQKEQEQAATAFRDALARIGKEAGCEIDPETIACKENKQ